MRVDVDSTGVLRALAGQDKRQRIATARALDACAVITQRELVSEMRRIFDRPTPYALNATRVIRTRNLKPEASVWLKDRKGLPASRDTHYLYTQVFGGRRGRKAFETALLRFAGVRSNEFLVPAKGAPLDAFGNVPASVIRQILSQLGAAEQNPKDRTKGGYSANVKRGAEQSAQSKRRQLKAGTFFIPPAGGPLPRGIYQRKAIGQGRGRMVEGKEVPTHVWATHMIFKIVVGRPNYGIGRLQIARIGNHVVAQHYQREFDSAYQQLAGR